MLNYNDFDDERIYILDTDNLNSRDCNLENDLKIFIKNSNKDISLDLKNVKKINSLTLAMLVRIQQKLNEDQRALKLINLSESVNSVLEWSGLDDKFIIE